MCRSHAVHGVHPPPKSHTLSVTAPCRWHVNRQRGRREGGSSFIPSPSTAHPAGTHQPSYPLLPSLPPSIPFSSTPATHAQTITSTDLAHNQLYTTAPPTQPASPHTHTSQSSPNPCASAQRKRNSSSSSSSPTARVPHHHHQQPMSSSTCMPHLHTQAASGTCVSE